MLRLLIISFNFGQIQTDILLLLLVECSEAWMPEGWLDQWLGRANEWGPLLMVFLINGTNMRDEATPKYQNLSVSHDPQDKGVSRVSDEFCHIIFNSFSG